VLALTTTTWWIVGYTIAAAVVLVAAALLLLIIALGRRIVRQAGEIAAALDGTRANTNPLFDVVRINHALDRITRDLATVREGLRS
jgi:hypothetical protein